MSLGKSRYGVFFSSTNDPKTREYRLAAKSVVIEPEFNDRWFAVEMDNFSPGSPPPAETCRKKVLDCVVYVGVAGPFYGSLVPDVKIDGHQISYSEFEYQVALDNCREIGIFTLPDSEYDPKELVRRVKDVENQNDFKDRLSHHTLRPVDDVNDFKDKLRSYLRELDLEAVTAIAARIEECAKRTVTLPVDPPIEPGFLEGLVDSEVGRITKEDSIERAYALLQEGPATLPYLIVVKDEQDLERAVCEIEGYLPLSTVLDELPPNSDVARMPNERAELEKAWNNIDQEKVERIMIPFAQVHSLRLNDPLTDVLNGFLKPHQSEGRVYYARSMVVLNEADCFVGVLTYWRLLAYLNQHYGHLLGNATIQALPKQADVMRYVINEGETTQRMVNRYNRTGFSAWVVVDKAQHPVGWLSAETVKQNAFGGYRQGMTLTVGEVKERFNPQQLLKPDFALQRLAKWFAESRLRLFPVVENGKLIQVITYLDILDYYRQQLS